MTPTSPRTQSEPAVAGQLAAPRASAPAATPARSATRPRTRRGRAPAVVVRRAKSTIGGSRSIPFSVSRSQRSNQRISSRTWSIRGPGIESIGFHVAPRPHQQPLRHLEVLEQPERRAAVEVAPAADDHRRHADQVVVRPHRALAPERPVRLLLDRPVPRHHLVDPPQPLLAPVLAGQSGHRRQRVHRDHRTAGSRTRSPCGRRRRSGCRRCSGRPSRRSGRSPAAPAAAASRRAASRSRHTTSRTCPTAPVHQSCAASQLDHRAQVVGLARRVLVDGDAVRRAGASRVDPADGVVALVAQPAVVVRPDRDVVLAVRVGLDQRRPRARRLRKVKGGRQPHAVGHRDEDVRLGHEAESLRHPPGSPVSCRAPRGRGRT